MELSLIGLFFLVRDVDGHVACDGQAICMIVVFVLTIGYQLLLNEAFNPLLQYLPITLEDDAVRRDEEFSRAQMTRLGLDVDVEEEQKARRESEDRYTDLGHGEDDQANQIELKSLENDAERQASQPSNSLAPPKFGARRTSWADRSTKQRSKYFGTNSNSSLTSVQRVRENVVHDAEAQGSLTHKRQAQALFAGIQDELEDLTPDERDQLVQRAFQHDALRAKRPVIWIPRDDLGVSDDEVYRTQRFSKHIWISNEYQALDGKCRTIFSRSPPDFSEIDLIQL